MVCSLSSLINYKNMNDTFLQFVSTDFYVKSALFPVIYIYILASAALHISKIINMIKWWIANLSCYELCRPTVFQTRPLRFTSWPTAASSPTSRHVSATKRSPVYRVPWCRTWCLIRVHQVPLCLLRHRSPVGMPTPTPTTVKGEYCRWLCTSKPFYSFIIIKTYFVVTQVLWLWKCLYLNFQFRPKSSAH